MEWVFIENKLSVLILENKEIGLILVLVVLNNILEIVSLIDICTRHRMSYQNVDHNIYAQT